MAPALNYSFACWAATAAQLRPETAWESTSAPEEARPKPPTSAVSTRANRPSPCWATVFPAACLRSSADGLSKTWLTPPSAPRRRRPGGRRQGRLRSRHGLAVARPPRSPPGNRRAAGSGRGGHRCGPQDEPGHLGLALSTKCRGEASPEWSLGREAPAVRWRRGGRGDGGRVLPRERSTHFSARRRRRRLRVPTVPVPLGRAGRQHRGQRGLLGAVDAQLVLRLHGSPPDRVEAVSGLVRGTPRLRAFVAFRRVQPVIGRDQD